MDNFLNIFLNSSEVPVKPDEYGLFTGYYFKHSHMAYDLTLPNNYSGITGIDGKVYVTVINYRIIFFTIEKFYADTMAFHKDEETNRFEIIYGNMSENEELIGINEKIPVSPCYFATLHEAQSMANYLTKMYKKKMGEKGFEI